MASSSTSPLENAFGEIKETASFSVIAPRTFTSQDYGDFKPYKITTSSGPEINSLISVIKQELKSVHPSDNFPYCLISLAANLKGTTKPYTANILETNLEGDTLPVDVTKYLGISSSKPLIDDQKLGKVFAAKPSLIKDQGGEIPSETPKESPEYDTIDHIYYPYLCSYLLKLLVKTEYNVKLGFDNMNLRFTSFYSKNAPLVPSISEEWLRTAKTLITSDPKIGVTWVKTFVPFEKRTKTDSKDLGLVRFIAILPLSYTGMHAYKLFGEVKIASKLTNKFLIHGLSHPLTLPGLKQIVLILNEHEKQIAMTSNQREYDPAFKYARLLSPQYFTELQTKNCPALVYVLVELLYKYRKYDETNQNPSSIIGISSVPDSVKSALSRAATLIYTAGQTQQAEYTSPFMADAFKGTSKPTFTKVSDNSIFSKPATQS